MFARYLEENHKISGNRGFLKQLFGPRNTGFIGSPCWYYAEFLLISNTCIIYVHKKSSLVRSREIKSFYYLISLSDIIDPQRERIEVRRRHWLRPPQAALGDHALSDSMQSLAGCNPSAEGRPNLIHTENEPTGVPMVPLQISRCLVAPKVVALSLLRFSPFLCMWIYFTVQHPFYFFYPNTIQVCDRVSPDGTHS
jgi:hypothetical protein